MTDWERTKCYQISKDINDSIDIFGTITKEELREHIDLIFKAESVNYKSESEMKDKIYDLVMNKMFLYVENFETGELKQYKTKNEICEDIGIHSSCVGRYLLDGIVYRKKYLIMGVNKIRV